MRNYCYKRKNLLNCSINYVKKKQKTFALVSKFRNYSKFFKFGKYRQIWKANVLEISKFEISKKVFEF